MLSLFIAFVSVTASVVLGASAAGIDVVDNFCMRLNHQSIVKNGTLYIDGGIETFTGDADTPIIGYNTELIEVDMRSSWDWKHNISINAVNKTANPDTGTSPPLVDRGTMYSGPSTDPNIYLYGGTVSYLNTSFPGFQKPTSSQYALWSYDTAATEWDQYDVKLNAPYRPAGGAHAEAPDQGLAFYLNGFVDNGTNNQLENMDNFRRYLDGMIVINTESNSATNVSTDSLRASPRAKGGMTYVPNVGTSGILVAVGGVTKPSSDSSASNEGTYVTFNEIDFLDVSSLTGSDPDGTWYAQKATGDIPSGRTDFCLVTASAKDNSSHNIYMYGGRGANEDYDEIYVLSIPSFTWTKIYRGDSPRFGHTCHLVANRQLLTVGGSTVSDLLSACDWEEKGVAIFDTSGPSSANWGSVYDAYASAYQVPDKVYNVIGGDADGNADMNAPKNGFSTSEIANFFHRTTSHNSSTHSSSPDSSSNTEDHGLSGGAIAGAVIGSVAGTSLILALIVFLRRQRATPHGKGDGMSGPGRGSVSLGAIWRNRHGDRVELPGTEDGGQSMPPVQLQDDRALHELDASPVCELPANTVGDRLYHP